MALTPLIWSISHCKDFQDAAEGYVAGVFLTVSAN